MENKLQSQSNKDTIDIGSLTAIAVEHKKQLGSIIFGCTLLAAGISFVLPKQYESTTLVRTNSIDTSGGSVASMMGFSGNSVTDSYIGLMQSRRVLDPIIESMEWESEKKKPDAKTFAKQRLEIQNTKKTNLITITAKGKTPEEAQMISQGVADNFLKLQTDANQQTQSILVKFLEERIEEARTDAEEAKVKFAEYQQEHKIYSPDEQARKTVEIMNAYDEALGKMQVQQKTNQAKLAAAEEKLGDIRSSSQTYNINDSENVEKLRNSIVSAEIQLLNLRASYTEEHPAVISAKEKINKLKQSLADEVNTMVASKYTTLNPTQAALISEQANAEVNVAVAKASEAEIQRQKAEKEKELEGFPRDVLEYSSLQRETNIKDQIYTNLIKQAENSKIKQAMDSMDIQIIDEANLPDKDKPSAPKKKIVVILGAIVGMFISILFVFRIYINLRMNKRTL